VASIRFPTHGVSNQDNLYGNIASVCQPLPLVKKTASVYCRWADPIYRRRGTAREVIRRILKECREAAIVELVTHPENENAIRLYSSLGFRVERRVENYFGEVNHLWCSR
jgi:ribosomal protein S18 acetylase RimI-like enzyme